MTPINSAGKQHNRLNHKGETYHERIKDFVKCYIDSNLRDL